MKKALVVFFSGDLSVAQDVKALLDKENVPSILADRDAVKPGLFSDKRLVIVIGGDGTFLRASHFNRDAPMVGINTDPAVKEGFFMRLFREDYEKRLHELLGMHEMPTATLLRLNVELNGKRLPEYALNDVYVGDAKPYMLFNYDLTIGGNSEFQRGSGVIIGTPAGSTAWLKSAGGQAMEISDSRFQFIARELYERRLTKDYILKSGIPGPEQDIRIAPRQEGIVVIDSVSREYRIKPGDRVRVYASPDPLPFVIIDD